MTQSSSMSSGVDRLTLSRHGSLQRRARPFDVLAFGLAAIQTILVEAKCWIEAESVRSTVSRVGR